MSSILTSEVLFCGDLLKLLLVKRSLVEKRNLVLFLWTEISFLKIGNYCLFDCIIVGFE